MEMNKDKFDTGSVKNIMKSAFRVQTANEIRHTASKLRKGISGEGEKEVSPEQLKALDAKWKEIVEPVCGCSGYQELRDKINKELGRSFGSP